MSECLLACLKVLEVGGVLGDHLVELLLLGLELVLEAAALLVPLPQLVYGHLLAARLRLKRGRLSSKLGYRQYIEVEKVK